MTGPSVDDLFGAAQGERLQSLSRVPPTLSQKDGVGLLSFEAVTLSTFEAGKKMPGRYRWEGKTLRFELNEHTLRHTKKHWPNVIVLRDRTPIPQPPAPPPVAGGLFYTMRLKPFAHQQEALSRGAPQAAFAYLMDMGTGKTKVAIDDAAYHFSRGEIDRVLLVAPNGVHEQWTDKALPEHWPLALPIRAEVVDFGDRRQVKRKLVKVRPEWMSKPAPSKDCLWLCVNIENIKVIQRTNGRRKWYELDEWGEEIAQFLLGGPAMIIWDESHKGKNPGAKRSIAMNMLSRVQTVRYKRILTGTPMAKGIEDYYSQFKFLDPGIIGVWSMSGFKQQFCVMGGYENSQIVGYRDTDEFHTRIAPYSYRVNKSDVLDLPPKLYGERTCDLHPEQRRIYNELRHELMTELSDGTQITVEHVIQRMLRLQQVTLGYLPREDGSMEDIPHNRMTPLNDLIEQAPDRVVIWARFREDITRLTDALGDEAVRYDGLNNSTREREEVKRLWTSSSHKRFFVGNAAAGGTGLDWINGATTVIYYSNSFSSLDRWQSEDRTHRIGTVGTVNYYDIICRATIDRAILANLRRKRDVSDMSLTELRELLAS